MRIMQEQWFREALHLPKGGDRREKQLKEERKIAQKNLKNLRARCFELLRGMRAARVSSQCRGISGRAPERSAYQSCMFITGSVACIICGTSFGRREDTQSTQRRRFLWLMSNGRRDLLALFKHPGQQRAKVYFPLP